MTPEDRTVDGAAMPATPGGAAVDDTGAATAGDQAGAPASADAIADGEATYRRALDSYMNGGDLQDAVRMVDEVMETGPEPGLKSRLEKLRRRVTARLEREAPPADAVSDEPPAGGDAPPADAPPVETPADAPTADAPPADAPSADAPSAETPTADAPSAETPTADAPSSEPVVDEPVKGEDAPSETQAEEPRDAAKGAETPAVDEPATDAAPSTDAAEVEAEPKAEPKAEPRPESKGERPAAAAPARRPPAARPGPAPAGRPAGAAAPARPAPAPVPTAGKPPVGRRPGSGVMPVMSAAGIPVGPPPSGLKAELDRMSAELDKLRKAVGGVEVHIVKVAEAYGKLAKDGKRKDQAYDQLYEELRQYKDNFLRSAQKPLFLDLILLFDGVSRTIATFADLPAEGITREAVVDALTHTRDEILELLYRRDIERIDEVPKKLDINFQKPVSRLDTDNPDEDRDIAQVVREGFRWSGAVLRAQEVVVKRCTDGASPKASPTKERETQ